MKRKLVVPVLIMFLFIPLQAEKKGRAELPERYKKWLEEEVIYIITKREKDVFLQLETDKGRDIFIEAFWKQRDPTPGTPQNEFKQEHYRRFSYATEFFGRGTPRPGWKTDQGRIYIILGPPNNIEEYENVMNVHPTQIWFYYGEPRYGFPTAFKVIFFKKEGFGEYVLYSPSIHGPHDLIADYIGSPRNVQEAYQALSQFEPNLAQETLSLIPGERILPGAVSLASNKLLSNIYSYPQKRVEDTYAEAILKYKDIVEVEYTANYISSDSLVRIIKDDSGFFLVHYSVEPKKLSVDFYDNKYNAHFKLDGRVSDLNGKTIYQYSKEIPLSFTGDQIKDIESKSFALQDMFPLVAGHFRFALLIKNTISKEFTSLEKDIIIPSDISALQISSLILGYKIEKIITPSKDIVPFRIGENQVLCQPREIFTQEDTLVVFFQVLGLNSAVRSQGQLKFTIFKEEEEFFSQTKKFSEFQTDENFIEELSLKNYLPGFYRIKVSVLDKDGNEVLFENEDFEITTGIDLPRPLVISRIMPASFMEEYTYILGIQQLNQGNIKEAISLLGEAYHKNPVQLKFALGYSQALFINGEYQKVKEVLMPFFSDQVNRGEVLYFLGKSCHALGQFTEAISYYKNYLSRFGTNLEILNLMGTCYYRLGNRKEALQIWQSSLEINPNQEEINKLVNSLKEKKE
ncbi:MAG: GWxTD domain-containing protein [Candidatus Aminicenantaceae bacterium]